MAKVVTLRDRVKGIMRQYKKVNAHRFLYNTKGDLLRKYSRIKCYFLIHDSDRGYSIFPFIFKRATLFSVSEWTTLMTKTVGKYDSLYSIFTQAVLPAINNKGGSTWRFKSLLGWSGLNDLRPGKNPTAHRAGNKTSKKRTANERSKRRRRQRN